MPDLEIWPPEGRTTAAALALFDTLSPVALKDMIGRWRGSELPTGHPLDGLLTLYGWRGKRFTDTETVDPLLFEHGSSIRALNPAALPLGLALALPRMVRTQTACALFHLALPLLGTSSPKARLRSVEWRGQVSAAMVYDNLPIIDHFRRVDDVRVLGVMDLRLTPAPFFFLLTREP